MAINYLAQMAAKKYPMNILQDRYTIFYYYLRGKEICISK